MLLLLTASAAIIATLFVAGGVAGISAASNTPAIDGSAFVAAYLNDNVVATGIFNDTRTAVSSCVSE